MGNLNNNLRLIIARMDPEVRKKEALIVPVEFEFHPAFPEDTVNGLYLNNVYIPEEIVMMVLSHVPVENILQMSLVCKKWCNIVKSHLFWSELYTRKTRRKAKQLPWYVYYCYLSTPYFATNLIRNGNGQKGFQHWTIMRNGGNQFAVEQVPVGCDPLPLDVADFNGASSCFVTSFQECCKLQQVSLEKSRLMQFILNRYKPHIYLSEWIASRFDCSASYSLSCKLFGPSDRTEGHHENSVHPILQANDVYAWEHNIDDIEKTLHSSELRKELPVLTNWTKVELLLDKYPSGVARIVFEHSGADRQFWRGHYGAKMAGAVLRILFDTINPLPEDFELD